jgi:sugar lactone lactonase YvrE
MRNHRAGVPYRFQPDKSHNRRFRRGWIIFAALLLSLTIILVPLLWWWWTRAPKPYAKVVTLAVVGRAETPVKTHYEPFGLAADDEGNIFVSESATGRIYRISIVDYSSTPVAEGLETPSAVAIDRDGNLIVANTGAQTIVRVDLKNSQTKIIAGADGQFSGPVGVAAAGDGSIFVADTYHDRILVIAGDGQARTLAGGGEPGFADGAGAEARFDTPCGIAIAKDGSLLVADTGNHRIRRVELNGRVTTIAGTGEADERDGPLFEAAFDEPTAIVVRDKNSFFVADAGGSAVRLCELGEQASVKTIAGGYPYGFVDGTPGDARLNRPTGLALLPGGELAFADSGNGVARAFIPDGSKLGRAIDPKSVVIQAQEMRSLLEPRWPFDPPQARRDIAGTFGEVRGERLPDHDAWFHNGLDVPGAYGETARAVFTERVTRPFAVEDAGGLRERLRLSLFEYIHLRIGRDQNDQPMGNFQNGAISFRRDAQGRVAGVRLRRGTRINAGDAIGTLNRLNHVHLIAGPPSFEFNALAVLKLPGLVDSTPPVIEAVKITNERGEIITMKAAKQMQITGKLRIAVRAYDQVDGNPRYRRLGVYRLGYQVFNSDGSPAPDFREPRYHIVFDRLPADYQAVDLAFAEGSQSGYQGATVFDYLITNVVRGGEAREDFWDTTKLAPGNYRLRVLAEDYFGNQARRELAVTVAKLN